MECITIDQFYLCCSIYLNELKRKKSNEEELRGTFSFILRLVILEDEK